MNVPSITIPNFRPKCSKSIPVFRPKRLKNHTLWGDTYLYTSYRGVPLPPPGERGTVSVNNPAKEHSTTTLAEPNRTAQCSVYRALTIKIRKAISNFWQTMSVKQPTIQILVENGLPSFLHKTSNICFEGQWLIFWQICFQYFVRNFTSRSK